MKLKNKKFLIFIILLVIFVVIFCSLIIYKNIDYITTNIINKKNETEQETISINVEIKSIQSNINKCLVTFISNDESEKIKSIQYPGEENNIININNGEGKQKVAIDYDIETGKEDSTFKVTTTSGQVIEKRTGYTIHYDVNSEDANINNRTKSEIINRNAKIDEIPTRDGYTFYGWSKKDNSIVSEYERIYTYQKGEEDITLYAVWRKNADNITTANSLIEATEAISETCQVSLNINNVTYDTDTIVYNRALVLDGNSEVEGSILNNKVYEFGNKYTDVARENEYAKNMVILKVNGDLTIGEGVTLKTCASENGYGGPKGLFVYCTGTITNYGTISMTGRGAYAQGQNVYLFKNASGAYEYVPAVGGTGGSAINVQRTTKDGSHEDGKDGESVEKNSRQTGGGGSGKVYSYTNYTHYEVKSGKGGNGTSYSGGSGGGSNNAYDRINDITMNGDEKGGIGGKSYIYTTGFPIAGGVGNPGGLSFGSQEVTRGKNGTGGLLIISANSINNTGKIEANGVGNGRQDAGGSSGGGSINIFYKEEFTNTDENNITAKGGISTNYATYGKAGDGGNGSVTIGSIESGTFVSR